MTSGPQLFRDRRDAGRVLAAAMEEYRGADAVVLGLARGGMPVAAEVADELELPLDVFVVRKLGVPGQPELALGAVASGGARVINDDVLAATGVDDEGLDEVVARESAEVLRRERAYREGRPALDVAGRTAILVDDGVATGASMMVAIHALLAVGPAAVVVAVPVAPADTCAALAEQADNVVCPHVPTPFFSVGSWYVDFTQTADEEVSRLLQRS